jgi:hypothetical protein
VTGWPATSTCLPFANASTSSSVAAIPSTAPSATASLAGDDRALSTVDTAHETLRWRSWAIAVIFAIASFLIFSPIVPPMSSPWPPTGDAAPIEVPGAISAMFEASVMNVPALAANPRPGRPTRSPGPWTRAASPRCRSSRSGRRRACSA